MSKENQTDFEKSIDPELLTALRTLPTMTTAGKTLGDVRALLNQASYDTPPFIAHSSIHIEDRDIPGPADNPKLKLRIYRPASHADNQPLPVLLWIHGGGFFLGDVYGSDALCQDFVLNTQCVVVSVEYRLAPEHPFPAAFEDCYSALLWLASEGAECLSIDPDRIVVGGCSAGGCLAAGVVLRAKAESGPAIAYQLLIIPVLDDRHETASSIAIVDPRVWHREISISAWSAYLHNGPGNTPEYAAPARASCLEQLPPTFISVEEQDLLRDEAIIDALRLMEAGVRTELHVYPGTFHGSFAAAPEAAVSQQHWRDITSALKKALSIS